MGPAHLPTARDISWESFTARPPPRPRLPGICWRSGVRKSGWRGPRPLLCTRSWSEWPTWSARWRSPATPTSRSRSGWWVPAADQGARWSRSCWHWGCGPPWALGTAPWRSGPPAKGGGGRLPCQRGRLPAGAGERARRGRAGSSTDFPRRSRLGDLHSLRRGAGHRRRPEAPPVLGLGTPRRGKRGGKPEHALSPRPSPLGLTGVSMRGDARTLLPAPHPWSPEELRPSSGRGMVER